MSWKLDLDSARTALGSHRSFCSILNSRMTWLRVTAFLVAAAPVIANAQQPLPPVPSSDAPFLKPQVLEPQVLEPQAESEVSESPTAQAADPTTAADEELVNPTAASPENSETQESETEETSAGRPDAAAQPELPAAPQLLPPGQTVQRPSGRVSQSAFAVRVPEVYLNRLIETPMPESGPLVDQILEADVRGWQSTRVQINLDVKPEPNGLQFWIVGQGTTNVDTVGVTRQAAVRTVGTLEFQLQKPVWYRAGEWWSEAPTGGVMPMTQNVWAKTPVGDWPIIGPLANSIAFSEASKRKPAFDEESARKSWNRVSPKFNTNIDNGVAKLAAGVVRVGKEVPQTRLFQWNPVSSEDAITVQAQLKPDDAVRIDTDWTTLLKPSVDPQISLAMHESAINRLLRNTGLNGLEFTDADLEARLEVIEDFMAEGKSPEALLKALKEAKPAEKPSLARFKLDNERPFSVQLREGRFIVEVRGSLIPIVGSELKNQLIQLPFQIELADNKVVASPQAPEISTEGDQEGGAVGAGVAQTLLKQQIASKTKEITLPTTIDLASFLPQAGLRLTTQQVAVRDGWLVVASADKSIQTPSLPVVPNLATTPQPAPNTTVIPTPTMTPTVTLTPGHMSPHSSHHALMAAGAPLPPQVVVPVQSGIVVGGYPTRAPSPFEAQHWPPQQPMSMTQVPVTTAQVPQRPDASGHIPPVPIAVQAAPVMVRPQGALTPFSEPQPFIYVPAGGGAVPGQSPVPAPGIPQPPIPISGPVLLGP